MPFVGQPILNPKRIEEFVAHAWGGGDGIIRGAGQEGVVMETIPASLSVRVGTFKGFGGKRLIDSPVVKTTAAITAPSGGSAGDLRRIDLVLGAFGTGIYIKEGTEAGTPEAPEQDADTILFARLHLRTGMASIKDADDSTNGYIEDARTFR